MPDGLIDFVTTLPTRLMGIMVVVLLFISTLRGPPPGASPQLLPDVYLPSTSFERESNP